MLRAVVRASFAVVAFVALVASPVSATVYYVDAETGDDMTNSGLAGSPFATIEKASSVVQAGDKVLIRGSATITYNEPIEPLVSGDSVAGPIIYEGWGTERPKIIREQGVPFGPADLGYCIVFRHFRALHHVIVRNVECNNHDSTEPMLLFGLLQNTEYVEIRDSIFLGGNAGFGIDPVAGTARFNTLAGNLIVPDTLHAGAVNTIHLQVGSEQNLIEDNDVLEGGHDAIMVLGSRNVIRNNRFLNANWRPVEISGGVAAERNVFEGNEVHSSAFHPVGGAINVMQLWAPRTIIRRNLFHANGGTGINVTRSIHGAPMDIRGNHIYHNVLRANGDDPANFYGFPGFHLQVKNGNTLADGNVLMNNVFELNDHLSDRQILIDGTTAGTGHQDTVIESNVIRDLGTAVIEISDPPAFCEDGTTPPPVGAASIAAHEACFPSLVAGNSAADPDFVDAANADFRPLGGSSPLIDAGSHLTTTTAGGTDTTIVPVADAGFFFDGFGIPGVAGDTVQLGAAGPRIEVTSVDYVANTLTVATPINFSAGVGVSLPFVGTHPDIGAVESTQCNDGIDNDGDGDIDTAGGPGGEPLDPACSTGIESNLEGTACDDDLDNDGDGKIDWDGGPGGGAKDPQCVNATRTAEASACGLGFELVLALPVLAGLRRGRRLRSAA